MPKAKTITRNVFCASDQAVAPHELTVDSMNGEILATCSNCGRTLKFPPRVTPEEFSALLEAHQSANEGQVSLEATERLVASLGDEAEATSEDNPEA